MCRNTSLHEYSFLSKSRRQVSNWFNNESITVVIFEPISEDRLFKNRCYVLPGSVGTVSFFFSSLCNTWSCIFNVWVPLNLYISGQTWYVSEWRKTVDYKNKQSVCLDRGGIVLLLVPTCCRQTCSSDCSVQRKEMAETTENNNDKSQYIDLRLCQSM